MDEQQEKKVSPSGADEPLRDLDDLGGSRAVRDDIPDVDDVFPQLKASKRDDPAGSGSGSEIAGGSDGAPTTAIPAAFEAAAESSSSTDDSHVTYTEPVPSPGYEATTRMPQRDLSSEERDEFAAFSQRAYSDVPATKGQMASGSERVPVTVPAATTALSTTGARFDLAEEDEVVDPSTRRRTRSRGLGRRKADNFEESLGTSVLQEELDEARREARRGTTSFGLLILRVAVGLIMAVHGAQKLFGWWGGPGIGGMEHILHTAGFQSNWTQVLAIISGLGEFIGGIMMVLGLLTPIAGAVIVATISTAIAIKVNAAPHIVFLSTNSGGNGLEYELLLLSAASALIFTGPGRLALDFSRGWSKRPYVGSVMWFIVGVAAAGAVWIFLNGHNPIAGKF